MTHPCDLMEAEPVVLAVTEAFVKQSEIPERITGLFDIVYRWIDGADVVQTGHNYALYDRFCAEGMRMRVGFPVSTSFKDDGPVLCLEMPPVLAVHLRHQGPYSGLHSTYLRLNEWCEEQSLERGALNWEVYGHWDDDPAKLITDVYIQLETTAMPSES